MTIEELQAQIEELQTRVDNLEQKVILSYRQMLRITNALQGSKVHYVATGPTGATQTPIKFKDGVLTSETGASGTP